MVREYEIYSLSAEEWNIFKVTKVRLFIILILTPCTEVLCSRQDQSKRRPYDCLVSDMPHSVLRGILGL
jgi:hypothetical protein